MDSPSEDKQWATKYLLDPLNEPEPSAETGPGTHFSNTLAASSTSKPSAMTTSKSPRVSVYPIPPQSASPTQSSFHPSNPYAASVSASASPSHRQHAFADYNEAGPSRRSGDFTNTGKGRRRGSSLTEQFPGDLSHRPLDRLRKEAKTANRSPHLRKKHIPGADIIDSLDVTLFGGPYHHEGPYDATLMSRNTSYKSSPVEAVRGTNMEALRATPREYIKDSLDRHIPLQGTAVIPPGMHGLDGVPMNYEEGADLMREDDAPGGPYKRWDHIKYLPEDYKGKGEPSFSIERALKEHEKSSHRRGASEGGANSYEMQPSRKPFLGRHRSQSGNSADLLSPRQNSLKVPESDGDIRRSNTTGRHIGEGLKRRWGSLRRSKHVSQDA